MANEQSNRRIAATQSLIPPEVMPRGARGRIVTAALRLFSQRGYGGTSVRDICAAANVYATTIYSHYDSKEHVLADLIRLGHEEHLSRLSSSLLACEPDPRLQLAAIVRAHVLSHCDYPMLAVVADAELHALSDDLAGPILAMRAEAEDLLVDVVQRGVAQKLFDVPDPFLTLRAVSALGLRVAYWYTPDCGRTPQDVADSFAELALRMVGAK